MEKSLFSQLFHNHYGLKDFTTQVLAGVLRSDQALLDNFVNNVLGIKGKNFVVDTQRLYQDVLVDMVFSNEDTLCFLEHTVQAIAEEQMAHLGKCQALLVAEQQEYSRVCLRYCSKYYDAPSIEDIDFAKLRWTNVCAFFQSYSNNPLVTAFLDFLEENNMKGIMELSKDDLIAISALNQTLQKMDECLDSVAAQFTMLFGYPSQGAPKETLERLKLLVELDSYRMMKQDILPGGGGWSELTLCFDYEKLTGTSTHLAVWYWCDRSHNQYEQLRKLFKQNRHLFSSQPGFLFEERPIGLRIILQKPLDSFESETDQLKTIHDWFVQTLKVFRKFADKTPKLNWNIPQ
jgi:hypothetical protein